MGGMSNIWPDHCERCGAGLLSGEYGVLRTCHPDYADACAARAAAAAAAQEPAIGLPPSMGADDYLEGIE